MPEIERVEPDAEFVRRILGGSGGDLKRCYQCATCAVACDLASDDRPFPRKEMAWAQWGLKDRLLADPDVWLCHQCNDCIERCPRGARPGDVMAALRRECVRRYAVPGVLADCADRPSFLPLLLAVPAALLAIALLARDPIASLLGLEPHGGTGMEYAHLFPHWLLIGFFTAFTGLSSLAAAAGVVRFWKAMKAADAKAGRTPREGGLVGRLLPAIRDVLSHAWFSRCREASPRRLSHLAVFYGFAALFAVTVWAVVVLYAINPLSRSPLTYPFAWWNPAKLLANLGALGLLAGCLLLVRDRPCSPKKAGASAGSDRTFLGVLLGVAVTGLAAEACRWAALRGPGYAVYFVHLVLVFALLVALPYSKFAHLVYRVAALAYAGRTAPPPSSHAGKKNP